MSKRKGILSDAIKWTLLFSNHHIFFWIIFQRMNCRKTWFTRLKNRSTEIVKRPRSKIHSPKMEAKRLCWSRISSNQRKSPPPKKNQDKYVKYNTHTKMQNDNEKEVHKSNFFLTVKIKQSSIHKSLTNHWHSNKTKFSPFKFPTDHFFSH